MDNALPPSRAYTYVTPKSPRQALLNALSQIEAQQVLERDRQADIILHHIRDYDSGWLFVQMMKRVHLKDALKALFGDEDDGTER